MSIINAKRPKNMLKSVLICENPFLGSLVNGRFFVVVVCQYIIGNKTKLEVICDSYPEFDEYFSVMWPKALNKLKEICESKGGSK